MISEKLPSLSRRQKDLLRCILAGMSDKEACESLGIANGTLCIHRNLLYQRLNITSYRQLFPIVDQARSLVL
jgi:DNA-binding CsgD family transcriptional regulator